MVASAMLITVQSHGKSTPEFSGFGFFFVTPKHRGTGVGKALSEKLLKTDKFVNTNGFLISGGSFTLDLPFYLKFVALL